MLDRFWDRVAGATVGVRALIFDRNERTVFLIRHTYVPGWQLPGGGVEVGETAAEALEREVREECDIALTGPAQLRSVHFNSRSSRRDHVLFYLVTDFTVVATKLPDREIAEAGFFPIDKLPDGVTPATRRRIDEVLSEAMVSPYW